MLWCRRQCRPLRGCASLVPRQWWPPCALARLLGWGGLVPSWGILRWSALVRMSSVLHGRHCISLQQRYLVHGVSLQSWPRRLVSLAVANFGRAAVAPFVGEAQRVCWWQLCRTATNFGVSVEGLGCGVQCKWTVVWQAFSCEQPSFGWYLFGWLRSISTGAVVTGHACQWSARYCCDNSRMAAL